jgi:hypothetical protein
VFSALLGKPGVAHPTENGAVLDNQQWHFGMDVEPADF